MLPLGGASFGSLSVVMFGLGGCTKTKKRHSQGVLRGPDHMQPGAPDLQVSFFLLASAGINCFLASVVLSLPREHVASLFLSIFSSGAGGSQMLKGYYETLRRDQSGSYLQSWGWQTGECFLSKQTWSCLWFLQGANSSAHSLYLVSREAIHKAPSQEPGMKLEWVFWLPNQRQASRQAGRQAEEQRGNRRSGKRLTFASHFQQSEDGPAAACYH